MYLVLRVRELIARFKLALIVLAELASKNAAVYTLYPWLETFSVTLIPESMSVTIVFEVPLGPKPLLINLGTTVVVEVAREFGEYTVE
jgi:hypothetical protein